MDGHEYKTMRWNNLILKEVEGHVNTPHYHKAGFRCQLCGLVQSNLILCNAVTHDKAVDEVPCQQCTKTGMTMIGYDTKRCWVPGLAKDI